MSRVQCKGCDYKPSTHDTLEGYCLLCAARIIKMKEQELSDHDRLICVDVKVSELKNQFTNHLAHHFRYSLMAWGVALTAIVGLVVIVIKVL